MPTDEGNESGMVDRRDLLRAVSSNQAPVSDRRDHHRPPGTDRESGSRITSRQAAAASSPSGEGTADDVEPISSPPDAVANTDGAGRRSWRTPTAVGTARRRFLQGLGALGIPALAGCTGVEDPENRTGDDRTDDSGTDDTTDQPPVEPPDADGRILTDTNEIYAGYFTDFGDGILIGAHPMAITEPVTVEVSQFEPELPEPDWPDGRTLQYEEFVEIAVVGHDEDWVETPTGTGFFVVLPVPEDLDVGRLEPMHFVDGTFVDHESDDEWHLTEGVYDAEGDHFIADVESLGAGAHPTRLGVVEQPFRETALEEPSLETIVDEYFPEIEAARDDGEGSGSQDTGRDHLDAAIRQLSNTDDWDYKVEWKAVAPEDSDIRSEIEDALHDAHPDFVQLDGDPEPRLITTFASKFRWVPGVSNTKVYKYYIRDSDQLVSACTTACDEPGGVNGRYNITTKFAYTCVEACNHEQTTVHELFHAIQYDYPFSANAAYLGKDDWVVEGTARLVQNRSITEPHRWNWSDPQRFERPVDIRLNYEEGSDLDDDDLRLAPYNTQYYWIDLLARVEFGNESMLGTLFDHGLDTDAVDDFIAQDTWFNSLADTHWLWLRNAAFEGDLDPPYPHQCEVNEYSFRSDVERIDLEPFPVVDEEHPDALETTYDLDPLSALTGRMLELVHDVPDIPYYYRLSFAGNGPRDAWLYPGHGPCFDTGTNWAMRTHNDRAEDTIIVENRGYPVEMSTWLLLQGSIGDDASLVVEGPFEHNRLWIMGPWNGDTVSLGSNLEGAVHVTLVDFDDEVEDIEMTVAIDGQPVQTVSLSQSPLSIPEFGRLYEFEIEPGALCAVFDARFPDVELSVVVELLDEDGDAVDTLEQSIVVELERTDVTLSHTIEADSRVDVGLPIYNPTQPNEPIVIADFLVEDGITLVGSGFVCEGEGAADVSDELQWANEDFDEVLSNTNELFLETPEDFEDEDGETRARTFILYHPHLDGQHHVTVQPCEPHCVEFRDGRIPDLLFEPVMLCPDGSIDPHCAVRDLEAFERDLDDLVEKRLFDGAVPTHTEFPLSATSEWPVGEEMGGSLAEFAHELAELVEHDEALATGNFHGFVRNATDLVRAIEPSMSRAEAEVAHDLLSVLSVGLTAFGGREAGGANGWRYFGYRSEELNPGTIVEGVDHRTPLRQAILGAGAALVRYGEDAEQRRERVRRGAAYGLLDGVGREVRRIGR